MALSRHPDLSLLRLFHFLLALFIIFLLVWGVVNRVTSWRQEALNARWQQRVAGFAERVELLHGEWLARGHPRQIHHLMAGESGVFVMNEAGWPIDWLPKRTLQEGMLSSRCARLWRGVLGQQGTDESDDVRFDVAPYGACLFRLADLGYRYDDLRGNVIDRSDWLAK